MAASLVIVGAGVAGLYAAQRLRKRGFEDIVIVEAMPYAGGRILPYSTPDGILVDLGGEFVHGHQNNLLWDMAQEQGWKVRHVFDIDDPKELGQQAVVVNGVLLPFDSEVAKEAQDLLDWLREEDFPEGFEDTSAYQYLMQHHKGASHAAVSLLDCFLAATWGTSLSVLGVKAAMDEEHNWHYGSENYILEGGCGQVISHLKQGLDIRYGWRVASIDYSGGKVTVTGQKGQQLQCDRVLVTVPLPVLQDGDIAFIPELPQRKLNAIQTLRMGQAGKVICTFTRQFWPPELHMVLTDNILFPQFWMYASDTKRGYYVVTGYITGPGLALADQQPRQGIIKLFVQFLDTIFDGQAKDSKVASSSLHRGMVHSWAKHPTVRGAYSYPSVGSGGCRAILAEPVADRVYFAGEAANPRSAANMHSSMESGLLAANAILAARDAAKL